MNTHLIKIHEIAVDGLPNMQELVGRVAFIHDGCIVSGWPLVPNELEIDDMRLLATLVRHHSEGDTIWEADSDVGDPGRVFASVTHWVEMPAPVHQLT